LNLNKEVEGILEGVKLIFKRKKVQSWIFAILVSVVIISVFWTVVY